MSLAVMPRVPSLSDTSTDTLPKGLWASLISQSLSPGIGAPIPERVLPGKQNYIVADELHASSKPVYINTNGQ